MHRLPTLTARLGAIVLGLGLCLGSLGCAPGEPAPVGTARLLLTAEMVAAADTLTLAAWQGAGSTVVWRFPDPDDPTAGEPDEALFDLEPGLYDRLELTGEVAGRPLYLGTSGGFEVEAGEEVVVRLVVDPFGRLVVAPSGLDVLDGVAIRIVPRDPLPGDPPDYPLERADRDFVADVPVGVYAIEVDLPPLLEAFETLDRLEAEVLAGGVITLRPAFGLPDSPEPPPLPPVVAEVLDLVLEGGQHLLGAALDVSVRALDGEGRVVPDYGGEVTFDHRIVEVAGLAVDELAVTLPAGYTFEPGVDLGAHVFADGVRVDALVGVLGLVSVRIEVTVSDDAGLEQAAQICIRGALGGCR